MYALTVFLGAFLLFQLQPIMGKYLLPWFGGGPGVWATCLFFFQAALLAGYAYAHVLTRYFSVGKQVLIHLALLLCALGCVRIVPSSAWKPVSGEAPWSAIVLILTTSVGVPYLVLASTGPLIQRWYSRYGGAGSPYRLYALSNVASLLALLSYPFLFEPHLKRREQAALWSWALVAYCAFCAGCALGSWMNRHKGIGETIGSGKAGALNSSCPPGGQVKIEGSAGTVSAARRVLWVLWPACASALLLATTNKLCLDVAVFPFLWIVPLSVYLLSFVICFDSPRWYSPGPYLLILAIAMPCLCWALFSGTTWPLSKQVLVYCGTLLVCCLICHGEVFRIRPAPEFLTEFYLLIAAGGALGGLFVSLLAPIVFNSYCELNWTLAVFSLLLAAARTFCGCRTERGSAVKAVPATEAPTATVSVSKWRGLGLALLWIGTFGFAATLWLQARRANPDIIYRGRNFYGVLTVFEHRKDEPRGHHYLLQHGRITHGLQLADPQLQTLATTYYGNQSGIGLALKALTQANRRIGIIGLGTGTIATYARPGDFLHFYEINPAVKELAAHPFTHLKQCAGAWSITPGDARLSLENEPSQDFDLLALDAFSSDAIPVHLLTREAFALYLFHLNTNGLLAVHVSNHFLDLEPVVLRQAAEFGLHAVVIDHDADPAQWWIYSSTWILLSRNDQLLADSSIRANARPKLSSRHVPVWTDDYCSLFEIVR